MDSVENVKNIQLESLAKNPQIIGVTDQSESSIPESFWIPRKNSADIWKLSCGEKFVS